MLEHIRTNYPGTKAHLLGLNRTYPQDVAIAARDFRNTVSGVDTDAPFVWAYNGDELGKVVDINYQRPTLYFQMTADQFPVDLVNKNIRTLLEWARG